VAFNVNDYIKSSSKSPTQRIVDTVVASTTSGTTSGTLTSAQSTAQSLLSVGSSIQSMSASTSSQTDNLMSSAADAFFALAGKNTSRATKASILNMRIPSGTEVSKMTPAGKIGAAKKNNEIQIITVR